MLIYRRYPYPLYHCATLLSPTRLPVEVFEIREKKKKKARCKNVFPIRESNPGLVGASQTRRSYESDIY